MENRWPDYTKPAQQLKAFLFRHPRSIFTLSCLVAAGAFFASHLGVIPGQYRIHRETCMEELGCFSIEGDFSLRPFNVLPQHRSAIGTKFILYTEDSEPREFSPDEAAALHDQLVEDKSLIIITHGWISSRADSLINEMIESLVTHRGKELNVVLVEWEPGSTQTYPQSVANTRVVGAEIARLLKITQGKIDLSRVHLVGSSLGAHICGTCGDILDGQIGRITALDAAGPLFEDYPESIRLDPSDAQFVDAIHTDGDEFYKVVIAEGGLGIHHSIGHADFYPSGGHSQPHCAGFMFKTLSDIANGDFMNIQLKKLVACDHELSLDYFMHSFSSTSPHSYPAFSCDNNQQGFVDGRCHTVNYMGYQAHKPQVNTNFYLHTAPSQPYKGSHFMVSLSIKAPHIVCLKYILRGETGEAEHIQQNQLRTSCSSSDKQTAMLFSDGDIRPLKELTVLWEDRKESHDQVLAHGLTQLTVHNVTVQYGDENFQYARQHHCVRCRDSLCHHAGRMMKGAEDQRIYEFDAFLKDKKVQELDEKLPERSWRSVFDAIRYAQDQYDDNILIYAERKSRICRSNQSE